LARLYANENFPLPAVQELRRLGHDVLTTHEAGQGGQAIADEAVLAFACTERRSLLTFNRKHFIHLHNQRHNHCGIIACSMDADFVGLAQRIHHEIENQSTKDGRPLIRVNRPVS